MSLVRPSRARLFWVAALSATVAACGGSEDDSEQHLLADAVQPDGRCALQHQRDAGQPLVHFGSGLGPGARGGQLLHAVNSV